MFKKSFLIFSVCLFFYGCNSEKKQSKDIQLKFLDEYVLPNNQLIDSTLVGGLSGIDYHNGDYYIVCDDDKNPRYYKAQINISNYKIDSIAITNTIIINETDKHLDLESIVIDTLTNDMLLVSEGSIKNNKDPSIIRTYNNGKLLDDLDIPQYFKVKGNQKPRHNGAFEGLARSFDSQGYWIATELPLKEDGPKPKFTETISPVRFTYFDNNGKPTKQFAYLLDKIGKKPLENFAVNGVTDLLEYEKSKLLIIERSYSSGYGNQGNVIKLYSVDYSKAANTIKYKRLTKVNYVPVEKELVFDFENVRSQLTNKSIDNIEGICFGPTLPNGHQSIILISDNNFDEEGQMNQFILMEIVD